MLRRNKLHKFLISFTALALMVVYSNVTFARTVAVGSITVTGNVSVNGQPAVSNSTKVTDGKIITGAKSGAVISFGTNGSLELFNDTSVTLKITKNSIVAMLTKGKIRVMNAAGIGATVTTRTTTVVADRKKANSFVVSLESSNNADCKETLVETFDGLVTMATISDKTLKRIPAGSSVPTQTGCQPCLRPGGAPPTTVVRGFRESFKKIFGWE